MLRLSLKSLNNCSGRPFVKMSAIWYSVKEHVEHVSAHEQLFHAQSEYPSQYVLCVDVEWDFLINRQN
jgi:hypothetical protein